MIVTNDKELNKLERVIIKNSILYSDKDICSYLKECIRNNDNIKSKECLEILYSFNNIYDKWEDINILDTLLKLNSNNNKDKIEKIYRICFTDKMREFIESNSGNSKEIIQLLSKRCKVLNRLIERYDIKIV